LRQTRKKFPKAQLVAGNVATARRPRRLIETGVNAIKVGVGRAHLHDADRRRRWRARS